MPPGGGGFMPPASVQVWLTTDALSGSADNDPVNVWPDSSGNSYNASKVSNPSTYKVSVIGGQDAVLFNGSDNAYEGFNDFSALTEGEIFIVGKITADPPAGYGTTGLWYWGSTNDETHFPYNGDSTIYDCFGTSTRKTTVNPTPSLASPFIYNVVSKSGEWTSRLNGTQIYTTGSNSVVFPSAPLFGAGYTGGVHYSGYLAELLFFSPCLNSMDRAAVYAYLSGKYGI